MRSLRRVLAVGLPILWVLSSFHLSMAQGGSECRRVLIGFKRAVDPDTRARVVHGAGGEVDHAYHLLPVVSAMLTDETIVWLKSRPDISYVEEDTCVYATGQSLPWGVDRIDAELAWQGSSGCTGAGVDVAILDTGIDGDHPDLSVAGGVNYVGQFVIDGSTRATDWNDKEGHGTHCAGVIAALDNAIGVVGVAPGASIWAVKVLDDDRSGYISDVIKGLEWCVDHGIEIASMSFAGSYSTSLEEACDTAYAAGVLLVAASGNSGEATVGYPAAYDSVIAISAIDSHDALAAYANTGPEVELTAPGTAIFSTYCDGRYKSISGTSMACPHVAGVAALVWACPELGIDDAAAVRARLCETAEKLDSLTAQQVGFGLVDAQRAASSAPVTDLGITAVVAVASVAQGEAVDVEVVVENLGNQEVDSDILVELTCDTTGFWDADDHLVVGQETISGGLEAGASVTLDYVWDTQDFSNGSYTLRADHNLSDDNAANDVRSASVTVRAAQMDIAISEVSGPGSVSLGDSTTIEVTVENVGDRPVAGDITVSLIDDNTTGYQGSDDVDLGSQSIRSGLAAGASVTLTYTWDVREANTGVHVLTANHDVADDTSDNDSGTTTMTVEDVALTEVVVSYVTPRSIWAGMHSSLMIRGDGFMDGLHISFEGGQGPVPTVANTRIMGSGSIVSRVSAPSELPYDAVTWDVRVTNPDGSSGVLREAFTVQP